MVVSRVVRALCAIISAMCLIGPGFAQDGAVPLPEGQKPDRAIVRVLVALSFDGIPDAARPLFTQSLVSALARADIAYAVVPLPHLYEYGNAAIDRDTVDYGVRNGCRLVLTVSVQADEKRITLLYRVRDITLKREYEENKTTVPAPDAGALADYFWLDFVNAVDTAASTKIPDDFLTITAPEGSIVHGFGEPRIVPESGTIDISVVIPQSYRVRVEKTGWIPVERAIVADRPGVSLSFEMERMPEWALEGALYNGQFPGFRVEWRPGGGIWFIRSGFEQYIFGLVLTDSEKNPDRTQPPWYGGIPLVLLGLGGGIDVLPQDQPIGLFATADLFLRLFFPDWRGVAIEPIAPLAFRPAIGTELRPFRNFSVFAEIGPVFYPFAMVDLMLATMGDEGPRMGMALGSSVFIEFFSLRVGCRWRLP